MEDQLTSLPRLTAKQELFCKEYVKHFNATAVTLRVGYPKSTARQIGHENHPRATSAVNFVRLMKSSLYSQDDYRMLRKVISVRRNFFH